MKGPVIKRILIVDDEDQYRTMLTQFLGKMGFSCEMATDAFDALSKLEAGPFDLVISDIRMKGKDGLELARTARKKWPDLDFIIMTGFAAEYSYSDIIDTGAADFISKPFTTEEMKAKVERIGREKRALRDLHAANRSLAEAAAINAAVAEVSEAVMTSLPFEEIATYILEQCLQQTESPAGFIGYMDRATRCMRGLASGAAVSGADAPLPTFATLTSDGESGWLAESGGGPFVRSSLVEESSLPTCVRPIMPVHRMASVPAQVHGSLLGQIMVFNAEQDYTAKDLRVLERLALIYALAIQRKWADEELKQTKDYLESVFENSAEAIALIDAHGRTIRWNKAATEMLGYTLDELRERRVFELYADPAALDQMLDRLRREGFVRRYEIDMKRKDGSVSPSEVSISLLRDPKGRVTGSVGVSMDVGPLKQTLAELKATNEKIQNEIEERKRVEEELRKARAQLERLVEERTAKLSKAGELLKRSIDRMKDITAD